MLECIKTGMRDLFRSKLRSFLTIGGISIGVLSVVVISSIGEIGKTEINAQMTDMGMDSVVVTADLNNYSGLKDEDLEKTEENSGEQLMH
ncbi:MAG TPA: ABC transporter permease, partial [Oscillospiraceae bacterium]|nr:ABC transporter permease [Oscillospiraceae bacterium]